MNVGREKRDETHGWRMNTAMRRLHPSPTTLHQLRCRMRALPQLSTIIDANIPGLKCSPNFYERMRTKELSLHLAAIIHIHHQHSFYIEKDIQMRKEGSGGNSTLRPEYDCARLVGVRSGITTLGTAIKIIIPRHERNAHAAV